MQSLVVALQNLTLSGDLKDPCIEAVAVCTAIVARMATTEEIYMLDGIPNFVVDEVLSVRSGRFLS